MTEYLLPKNKVSFSALTTFLDCPACYYAMYVEGLKGKTSISLPFGSAVHEGIAEARKIAAGFKAEGDPLQVAAEALDRELELIEPGHLYVGATAELHTKDNVIRIVKNAIEYMLPEERRRGIVAVESRVEFGSAFPFFVEAYADVILGGPLLLIKDTKTAKDARDPEVWSHIQVRLYGLPWHVAGQDVELQIDTFPKSGRHNYIPSAVPTTEIHYEATRQWVLQTAGLISDAMRSGNFPARPNWKCKFDHELAA